MNQFEEYLVELLQGNLTISGRNVPLLRTFTEEQGLPILTLDVLSPTTERVHREIGDAKHNVLYYRSSDININLWCNTEEEREYLSSEILRLFYYEQSEKLVGKQSLTKKHGLVWGTINIEPPFPLDERERHPPLLRNVFKCEASYLEKYRVDDTIISDVDYEIDV